MTPRISRRTATARGLSAVAGMGLAACVPGEGSESTGSGAGGVGDDERVSQRFDHLGRARARGEGQGNVVPCEGLPPGGCEQQRVLGDEAEVRVDLDG